MTAGTILQSMVVLVVVIIVGNKYSGFSGFESWNLVVRLVLLVNAALINSIVSTR